MHHPNQGFLRKFLNTDKEYQAEQKALQRKQEVAEFFERKKNKTYVLNEEHKKSIAKTIDNVYKSRTNLILTEQKVSNNWKPINTAYGIYYYNDEENLWMNNFGVIKKSLGEFIQIFDYGSIDGNQNAFSKQIPAPSDLQVTILNGGVGDFNIQFTDNSTDEIGFAVYITQVS